MLRNEWKQGAKQRITARNTRQNTAGSVPAILETDPATSGTDPARLTDADHGQRRFQSVSTRPPSDGHRRSPPQISTVIAGNRSNPTRSVRLKSFAPRNSTTAGVRGAKPPGGGVTGAGPP
jgi:hypothetical protein